MKIRISGFQLTYHQLVPVGTLSTELIKNHGCKIKFQGHNRILSVHDTQDHVFGSLITDRGHRNFLAVDTESNRLSRGTLGAKKHFGAFNFFVLCKRKTAGLITTYKDAGGPAFVFGYLGSIGDAYLREKLAKELSAGPALSKQQKDELRLRHLPPSLGWEELVGRSEYDAVLRRWRRIRAVEVNVKLAGSPAGPFVPAGDDAIGESRIRHLFKKGTAVSRAVETVKAFWNRTKREPDEVLKVDGIDEWGFSRTVEVEDRIPSLFGELDHDAIVADPTSFAADLSNSFVIRSLMSVVGQAPGFFG